MKVGTGMKMKAEKPPAGEDCSSGCVGWGTEEGRVGASLATVMGRDLLSMGAADMRMTDHYHQPLEGHQSFAWRGKSTES